MYEHEPHRGYSGRFTFSDSGALVRSAGPNRRFDDGSAPESDDYTRSN